MKRFINVLTFFILTFSLTASAQRKGTKDDSHEQLETITQLLTDVVKSNAKLDSTITTLSAEIQSLKNDIMAMKVPEQEVKKVPEFDMNLLKGANDAETAINTLMHNYFMEDKALGRYKHTIPSDLCKQAIKGYYPNGCHVKKLTADDIDILGTDLTTPNKAIPVQVGEDLYYVIKTNAGYKIDFLGSKMINKVLPQEYKDSDSTEPFTFRCYSENKSANREVTMWFYDKFGVRQWATIHTENSSPTEVKKLGTLLNSAAKPQFTIQVKNVYKDNGYKYLLFIKVVKDNSSEY